MAIKVSGTVVVDNDRNFNVGVVTATSLVVPPTAITFSPTDGSTDVSLTSNIVITYNTDVQKGSGNITLRSGSASGTVIETIAVSSGSVSISGGQVTINPSDFPTGKDIYVVVDEGAFESTSLGSGTKELNTYNFTTGPITVSSLSPGDGTGNNPVDTNIVITFSENITKGSGNITIRVGSASGTIRQTIDVTSGAVSVSGAQATINPPSDLDYDELNNYIVVDAGCFRNADGDVASGNALIDYYEIQTESDVPPLGSSYEGGYLICCSSGNLWIAAPSSTEVSDSWYCRNRAVTCANNSAACGDWFVPTCAQLKNPGHQCRTYWDPDQANYTYWSNTENGQGWGAITVRLDAPGTGDSNVLKQYTHHIRAFRCVSY